jgi:4-hydroxy-tetrahydrodipicolinate synthase
MTMSIGGIVASPVTPFTADNRIDRDTLARIIDFLIREGAHAVAMPMHMGESVSLAAEERRDVARIGIAAAAGRVPVFINVSLSGTDEAIALARDAEAAGAQGVVLISP